MSPLNHAMTTELIRVRGMVQGVGFRPMVWRLAHEHGLRGWVNNDGQGVTILACGSVCSVDAFVAALPEQAPLLARIETVERETLAHLSQAEDFRIVSSHASQVSTSVVPDAATCPECLAEIMDASTRRYRYPFTNCTHCGPRLSIIEAIPYDRAATTMREFALCPACAAEYEDPRDRRFHAQPVACPVCGPRAWLETADGQRVTEQWPDALDDLDVASRLIESGYILAIKGLGGFQLACDAGNDEAVTRLRQRKQRERKPFALMARDLDSIRPYCAVSETEAALLHGPAAPIVIMDANGPAQLAAAIAPGVRTLGFMLPNTPLHHLLLQRMERPIVLTSGNLSDEPQCIDNDDARARLGGIADYFLMHDRGVARRVDDSVVRVMAGVPRLMRRARGYAPAPLRLPEGFAAAPPVLAMGGELKNSFCLLRNGQAILSHHMGDLADERCHADYRLSISDYQRLFELDARMVAVDRHPEYLSGKLGRAMAEQSRLVCEEVQHHHAHIAACLADNGVALDAAPVIGVALDGLGFGDAGELWGGEFFLADYRQCQRLGSFKPVTLLGGEQAIYEPWRNTYAHLMEAMGWTQFDQFYNRLPIHQFLAAKPRRLLDTMLARGINSPLASSCGRLFDAVAAAAGICREHAVYEGQAAVEFEALVDLLALREEGDEHAYPLAISRSEGAGRLCLDASPLWLSLLDDLLRATPVPLIAARFHKGLAVAVAGMANVLSADCAESAGVMPRTVALSGGVFQNRVLLEQVVMRLERDGFRVLAHQRVPANDGGLALGQAAIAAARSLHNQHN